MSIKKFILPVIVLTVFLTGFDVPGGDSYEKRNLQIEVITSSGISCDGARLFVYQVGNHSNSAMFQMIPGTCRFEGTVMISPYNITTFMVDVCIGGPSNGERGHTTIDVTKVADNPPVYWVNTSYGFCHAE